MKRILLIGVLALAACGGGGGNPLPSAPQAPAIANTSLSYYLPLASGNTWTFTTGGKLVDMGSNTLSCACLDNGGSMERIAVYGPGSSSISGSFFIAKHTPQGGTPITSMVAVENDGNTNNLVIASSSVFPYGIPFMDDSPTQGESWTDGVNTSTISSIGGTAAMGNSQIIDIAVDQISSAGITWSFAKGVGFASIASGSQTATALSSFSVNTASSMTAAHAVATGHVGRLDLSMLKALLR